VGDKNGTSSGLAQEAGELDPHYLGFFKCFNRQEYFEAHEVLERLWLIERKGPDDLFYKGLIQLAGAFVHLQKDRLRPAAALFRLALANFNKYPPVYRRLNVPVVIGLTEAWLHRLVKEDFAANPLRDQKPPLLEILG
jgi:hypothetical protein